jgi:hypothetical protein
MSQMNLSKKALDEITAAAKNFVETAKRNGADLYFVFGMAKGMPALYAVPSGKWKRINAIMATPTQSDNSLSPTQGFDTIDCGIEFLDDNDECLLDLDP